MSMLEDFRAGQRRTGLAIKKLLDQRGNLGYPSGQGAVYATLGPLNVIDALAMANVAEQLNQIVYPGQYLIFADANGVGICFQWKSEVKH